MTTAFCTSHRVPISDCLEKRRSDRAASVLVAWTRLNSSTDTLADDPSLLATSSSTLESRDNTAVFLYVLAIPERSSRVPAISSRIAVSACMFFKR